MAKKTNFDIQKLVEEVYEAHSYQAAQKGLRYTFSISHKVPKTLFGDFDSVSKALSVITRIAIEDSVDGSVEINVDLLSQLDTSMIVKFWVVESSKQTPYWFSVALENAKSKRTA